MPGRDPVFQEWYDAYLIFSRSFEDKADGEMLAMRLSDDLKEAAEEPFLLFVAKDAPWTVAAPFTKAIPGFEGDAYLSDGPCTYRMEDGRLLILWSSFGEKGYAVGQAYSDNGEIDGKWSHMEETLFGEDGGHGMMF
jgi:hypothetical protein